ncbi:hypothetical protein CVT26_004314 [Gymnopilus dilepis]|uniref:CHAT domain-containing protein n=1 Tax=Gymnopilus dilepis TaxID=231916 RepID=A0A409WPT9_9AGAR|nr:hypothetical protein CVT26_004314 [Gymnopilus dilepis]
MSAPEGYIRIFGEDVPYIIYGQSLIEEFRRIRNMRDLNDGIELMESGLKNQKITDEERYDGLVNLADAMWIRFQHEGQVEDLNKAVAYYRQVFLLKPSSKGIFDGLACVLHARFEQEGRFQDLEESISLYRRALKKKDTADPDRAPTLDGLANALRTRFQQDGNTEYLDESISLHREALGLQSPHIESSHLYNNLANAVMTRYNQTGKAQDLDESISFYREALLLRPKPHPNRPTSLNNLATALSMRFSRQGRIDDLNESILLHGQCLELLSPHHPNRSGSLSNLANVLRTRFSLGGNIQDINESIELHRQALALRPPSHPDRPSSLNNLAIVLAIRFAEEGNQEDLNESISLHRQALDNFPSPSPNRADSLNNLAYALWVRFQRTGDGLDLKEAVSLYEEAIKLRPDPHPRRSNSLDGLANVLLYKFQKEGGRRDLDRSILLHREALDLRPREHPDHSNSLNNLAIGLRARYELQGNEEDLEESISLYRQALEYFPVAHPNRPGALSNLANALLDRFSTQGKAKDLDEAFLLRREALELSPINHPRRCEALKDLAQMHILAYERANSNPDLLDEAMKLFSEASSFFLQSSSSRFRKAVLWANHAERFKHPSALQAFDLALSILPELAAVGLDIQSRHDSLARESEGIARKAAACAIRASDFAKAVEFLETGRGVFWSQFLSLRSPMDELNDVQPELAKRLQALSVKLEKGSHRDSMRPDLNNRQKLSLEEEAQRFEKLANEWTETIRDIRRLKGFKDFLRPRSTSMLQMAAQNCPIIYLVANDGVSNCLVITSTKLHYIPLPGLANAVLSELVKLIRAAASEYQFPRSSIELSASSHLGLWKHGLGNDTNEDLERGMRRERHNAGHVTSDDIFIHVLEVLWDQVVKPVIDHLNLKKSNGPSRLTWCTTGLFSFLPVHAAGQYRTEDVDYAANYMISCYTPTIGVLLTPKTRLDDAFKMMAIIESRSLPSTRDELIKIEKHCRGDSLDKFGIPGSPASVEVVASRLSEASIVHFACHGKQDPTNPLRSGLEIGGEVLTIARIMKEVVPAGSLAFLSACETAAGDEKVPDEVLNIGASLLFTGFNKVVATMWYVVNYSTGMTSLKTSESRKMWDQDGPFIADVFYRELFKSPHGNRLTIPDTSRSAEALAVAVSELRNCGVPFKRWVPFVHMGI